MISSRRRSIFTLLAAFGTLLIGGALYNRLRAQETSATAQIAPGVTMLSVSTQTQNGPLRYWLVKADKTAAKLALEVADSSDVTKKKSVREIAAQSGALVAVNGGFFAYEGAAVGAVKVAGEWQRLPWKSRTALMWDESEAQIGAVSGECRISFLSDDGPNATLVFADKASLNGWLLPGTHTETSDGFAVLTSQFASRYTLKPSESGILVRQNRVSKRDLVGEVAIPSDGFLLLARGAARSDLNGPPPHPRPQIGANIEFSVSTTPEAANDFPNILGAGPLLVKDGAVKTTEVEEEFRPDVVARGPRTCVGFDAQGNTLLLVINGWEVASVGLTMPETALLFQKLGAKQAMNLDGGGSTQLVVGGKFINPRPNLPSPTETAVSNALVLKTR